MDALQASKRIEQLKAILWENSRKYYVAGAHVVNDIKIL